MSIPVYKPFIHNTFRETSQTFEVHNPFDGQAIATVYRADPDVLDEAVRSAQQGFEAMRRLSSYDRAQILHNIVDGIRARENEFVQTIVQESGKPIRFARNEVFRATITFTTAAEEAKRLDGEVLTLDMAPQTRNYAALAKRVPLGVVLGISPFNFPLNLVAHKIAPALAAGNSIILKPASQTPLTALLLAEVIRDAGIPEGGVNIVPASGKDAEELVRDARIRKLSFTGSAAVGWYLKSIAGKKYVTLELGGNAGVVVEPDADLDFAVPRLALGAFAYAGQVCISVQRIYVHNAIWDKFLNEFVAEVKNNIKMGDPRDPETVVGPMIQLSEAERIASWVQEAVDAGARVLAGGEQQGDRSGRRRGGAPPRRRDILALRPRGRLAKVAHPASARRLAPPPPPFPDRPFVGRADARRPPTPRPPSPAPGPRNAPPPPVRPRSPWPESSSTPPTRPASPAPSKTATEEPSATSASRSRRARRETRWWPRSPSLAGTGAPSTASRQR